MVPYIIMEKPKHIDESYMRLPSNLREKYVYETIRDIVFQNRDGVNTTQLSQNLPFSRKVIEKHLNRLVSINECYSKTYGRTVVYFPNSRAIHSIVDLELPLNGKFFRAVEIDNSLGHFIYLQEYQDGTYGREVKGGLMIPINSIREFITFLQNIQDRLRLVDNESQRN
jgi:hypothetical protein